MVPLHGTPGLSRLARADLPRARVLPLLPQQAGWRSVLHRSRLPVCGPCFPQPLWTTAWSMHWRLRVIAAAASQQHKAHARTVTKVRLSTQPPANRSVPRLRPSAAGLAPHMAGLPGDVPAPHRGGNAFQQPRRLAPPHRPPRGSPRRHRRRCAVPVPRVPVTPLPPHEGDLPIAAFLDGNGCAAPATGPLRSLLPPYKHLECNAVGLLRQGLASLRAPAGWPPLPGCQHGQEGVSDGPQCGERSAGAGWRAARGQRAPPPLASRCAPRVGRAVFHWPGCVPRIGTPWKASHGRGGLAGGCSSGAAPLACLWPLRFFLLEGDAMYAPLAPASRPGSFRSSAAPVVLRSAAQP